jgi:TonB family protein
LPLRLDGQVVVTFTIDPNGRVQKPVVNDATHPGFVAPAVAAVSAWTFQPALQGDLPTASQKRAALTFTYVPTDDRDPAPLAANGFSVRIEASETEAAYDVAPVIERYVEPVYPYALAVAGQGGEAEVTFDLNIQGRPETVLVNSASDPAVGEAVADAVRATIFRPALQGGKAVVLRMKKIHRFSPPPAERAEGESIECQLQRALMAGEKIPSARGLDTPLQPLWTVRPAYPEVLINAPIAGKAIVEFIVDREGRVRWPRVVEASHEAFGRVAVHALAQWAFPVPRRSGQPVDARLRVPFSFSPP